MTSQVGSLVSECKIPGGKVSFNLDKNSKLVTLNLSVIFQHFHCKFEKKITEIENVSDLEKMVKHEPTALYKKIIEEKYLSDSFLPLLKPELSSSKLTKSKGTEIECRNSKEFISPKKEATRTRSESLPSLIKKNDCKSNSAPEIHSKKTLGCSKRTVKLLNLPKEGSTQISPREGTQSRSSRTPRDETSPKERKRGPSNSKSPRNELSENSISSSPPDVSQGSISPREENKRRSKELKKPEIIEKSSSYKIWNGEVVFYLKSDQSLWIKLKGAAQNTTYEFKRSFSTLEKITFDFQSPLLKEPAVLFEKIMGKNFLSKAVHPFFQKIPETPAVNQLCQIYFNTPVPALPSNFMEIWNSDSRLTGKKVSESHTLYLISEECITKFEKTMCNPKLDKNKNSIYLSYHFSPDDFEIKLKTPYWALIADEILELFKKPYDQQVKLLKEKGGDQYSPSNLIEAGYYIVWNAVNNKLINPKYLIRCIEISNSKKVNMIMGRGNTDRDIEIKTATDYGQFEGILGVWRL